jgi:hypothetical protein
MLALVFSCQDIKVKSCFLSGQFRIIVESATEKNKTE